MTVSLRLEDIQQAWSAQDPQLADFIIRLADQPDEKPEKPVREGAPTFDTFLREIHSHTFRRKPLEEQASFRVEHIKALESATAEVPLPARLKIHSLILQLWHDGTPFARRCLMKVIAEVPLKYGPWKALKKIFKESEARGDTEIFGALAARFDMAWAARQHSVSHATLGYLVRRSWRYLRRIGESLPVCYADTAVDFLAHYTNGYYWANTWVYNHIFFHETKKYTRSKFKYFSQSNQLKNRAFADLWRRSPRPLFALLERGQCDKVWEYATSALKTDFRALLRDVEPAWVARLVEKNNRNIDEFVVWILSNVPRFEQAAFRDLGLHAAVLRLFDSHSPDARTYAAGYARTHARDLPVDQLVLLANNDHDAVRKLAFDLLSARDPRTEVGLEAWGQLLASGYANEFAAAALRKHFGARELTPEWFRDRLLSGDDTTFEFASQQLPQIHPIKKLGPEFFLSLIDALDDNHASYWEVSNYALENLAKFELDTLPTEQLQRLLVTPFTNNAVVGWVNQGKLKAQTFPVPFLKMMAFHPTWETDPWVAQIKQLPKEWAKSLTFNENISEQILTWLKDIRRFSPTDLGFDWLMQLVQRSEPRYHNFAVETMIKAFLPADFAPAEPAPEKKKGKSDDAPKIDLGGAAILFTGKLNTMTRNEAQDKVRTAGGAVASAVNKKLDYLVIGDEGSPLYGAGRKGDKQLKAEKLVEEGATIKIISETAFLQMLTGGVREVSADAMNAGCERLWQMLTAPGPVDAPLSQFALKYVRMHHPDICLQETDRPVDPGAEIPASFLTFDRVFPLFGDARKPLRDLALELSRWELARWQPPMERLVEMCEFPYREVREFVAKAMTVEEAAEHKRYRIDPAVLTAAAVYSFCESRDEATRSLGMSLIQKHPRLQLPEELFRLTESPDRRVRAFVVRTFWSLYHDRGITPHWKPTLRPLPTVGAAARKKAEEAAIKQGAGAPAKPENKPASNERLQDFLRYMLYELPPARLYSKEEKGQTVTLKLTPLPARKAKLELIAVMRDLAEEEATFAEEVLPVLQEFIGSRGQSEQAACLVAVTRVTKAHPQLVKT